MKYNDYELFYMVKESEEALSCLIKKYEPLYRKLSYFFIKQNPNKGLDIEDLIQECRLTTCYAIDKYSEKNNVLFYSYLLLLLKRKLSNIIRCGTYSKDIYYYMQYDNYDSFEEFISAESLEHNIEEEEFENKILNFKYTLKDLDSYIFELRFNGFSYKEIAILLDINQKKVDNSLLLTRKKLEKYLIF